MIYRLKEFKGDTIPVPQLVFSKLGIARSAPISSSAAAFQPRVRWHSGPVRVC